MVSTAGIESGPGLLYWAPLGTPMPTPTVAGNVFTDTLPAAWLPIGATDEGSTFNYELSTDGIEVAEVLDVVRIVTTARSSSVEFAMAEINPTNMKRAMNGGTITTTGTGDSTLTQFDPPLLGAEVRCMILWQSDAKDHRTCYKQCFQGGSIAIAHQKGATKATIPVTYSLEAPSDGLPFREWYAGTVRV